jgi:ABC-type multidrug transport system fused ATPase/permease subunit
LQWFKYAGGAWFLIVTFIGLGADRVFYVGTELWLSAWTSAVSRPIHRFGREFPPQSEGMDAQYQYLKFYFIILALSFTGTFARAQWMIQGGARVSGHLVKSMMSRLLYCPMSYFESTPIGRMLNRMTYDVDVLDITLSQSMTTLMTAFGWFITGVILQVSILPWVGFGLAIIAICYWVLILYYRKSSVDLQRLDSISRSPVQVHLSEGQFLQTCQVHKTFTINVFGSS